MQKVLFFFPWKEVSGGPNYLTSLANDLVQTNNYEVFYVDYKNGISNSLLSPQIKKIQYSEPFSLSQEIPYIIITPIYCASHIPRIHKDSKIVFVNWHNYCVQALVDSWRLSEKELQDFLQLVYDTDSVFFLDYTHWLSQNQRVSRNYSFPKRYVPIKINMPDTIALKKLVNNEINIAILGRLCKDKIFSVLNLLNQLKTIECGKNKNLYIIGDGEYSHLVEKQIPMDGISITFMGTMSKAKLLSFLSEKIDILFSMGMSVLDGASIGLPSVIMPHNIKPFNSDCYVYVHNSVNYAVGWYDSQIPDLGIITMTLSDIIDDVYNQNRKAELGQKDRLYVIKKHTSNIYAFEKAIKASHLDYRKFWKYAKKRKRIKIAGIPIAKIDSSFDENEKIISIPGFHSILRCHSEGETKKFFLMGRKTDWIKAIKDKDHYRLYIRIPFIKS